jgi:hypothetical protein
MDGLDQRTVGKPEGIADQAPDDNVLPMEVLLQQWLLLLPGMNFEIFLESRNLKLQLENGIAIVFDTAGSVAPEFLHIDFHLSDRRGSSVIGIELAGNRPDKVDDHSQYAEHFPNRYTRRKGKSSPGLWNVLLQRDDSIRRLET